MNKSELATNGTNHESKIINHKCELKARTKAFALRVIKLVAALPKDDASRVIGKQLLRAGTSVGANYRAACRGKSKADFASKLTTVLEEADECCYWIELLIESDIIKEPLVKPLWTEADELCAIFNKSIFTTRAAASANP